MSEADTPTILTFTEAVNSVNSTAAKQANSSDSDSPDEQRSHSTETMLTQPTQELAAAQEQLKCLFHELEASHQTIHRQQILIETLTAQLESSQERVAQLERECFLRQQCYNEQSHQLVQTENTCRELQTRLSRQQRQALQFKLALEKCLEVRVPSDQFQADAERQCGGRINPPPSADPFPPVKTRPLQDFKNAPYSLPLFLPKVQPIPPWSAQPESFTKELEPAWDSSLSPTQSSSTWGESSADDLPLAESPAPTNDSEELHPSGSDTGEAQEAHWEDLISLLEAGSEPETANSPERATVAPSPDLQPPAQGSEALNQFEHALGHFPDSASELMPSDQTPELQQTSSPQQETSSFTPNSSWPSPVIYPLRPPKGRKSLAAIELPTFPRISD